MMDECTCVGEEIHSRASGAAAEKVTPRVALSCSRSIRVMLLNPSPFILWMCTATLLYRFENTPQDVLCVNETQRIGPFAFLFFARAPQRPLVDMELRYEIIKGNHITPLTQNVFLNTPVDSIDPLLGVRQGMKKEFLKTVNHLGQILVDWLEESAPPVPPVGPGSSTSSSGSSSGGSAPAAAGAGGVPNAATGG